MTRKKKKNHKHLTFPVSSALKILLFAFASHRLLSSLKELCKYKPLHFFSLLHFVFLPHPSLKAPHPIVLTTSSPSLVDYMTEPRLPSCCSYSLQGRERNDKSYLQVTVGNSGNPRLGKIQAFFFFFFYPVFFDGRAICDAAR